MVCGATTRAKKPCQNKPKDGGRCHLHKGKKSPSPKKASPKKASSSLAGPSGARKGFLPQYFSTRDYDKLKIGQSVYLINSHVPTIRYLVEKQHDKLDKYHMKPLRMKILGGNGSELVLESASWAMSRDDPKYQPLVSHDMDDSRTYWITPDNYMKAHDKWITQGKPVNFWHKQ